MWNWRLVCNSCEYVCLERVPRYLSQLRTTVLSAWDVTQPGYAIVAEMPRRRTPIAVLDSEDALVRWLRRHPPPQALMCDMRTVRPGLCARLLEFLHGKLVDSDDYVPRDSMAIMVRVLPRESCGETAIYKVNRLMRSFSDGILVEENPYNIAWLLNLRTHRVTCKDPDPVLMTAPPCKLVVNFKKRSLRLFADAAVIFSADALAAFRLMSPMVRVRPMAQFHACLEGIKGTVVMDISATSARSLNHFENNNVRFSRSILSDLKCQKNAAEVRGMEKSCALDGLAWAALLRLLYNSDPGVLTEKSISRIFQSIKARVGGKGYLGCSFDDIVAWGKHARDFHYHNLSDKHLTGNELLMIDSGSQYDHGTTDITRTLCLSRRPKTARHKEIYTRVLKGALRLERAVFPRGTLLRDLDDVARKDLREAGWEYPHATCHGIGASLAVHEILAVPLAENMVVSDEPGYYEHPDCGVRIENMLLVVADPDDSSALRFRLLSRIPYDHSLICESMLGPDELQQIQWSRRMWHKIIAA